MEFSGWSYDNLLDPSEPLHAMAQKEPLCDSVPLCASVVLCAPYERKPINDK